MGFVTNEIIKDLVNRTLRTEHMQTVQSHSLLLFYIIIRSVRRWEMRHDRSSWGIFSVPICFRKEMSSRIDPGIRVKELGGLYINFDGSKSKPVSSSLQKLKEKKIQDEVNEWLIFPLLKVTRDAEWIMNFIFMQRQANPITPVMVLFIGLLSLILFDFGLLSLSSEVFIVWCFAVLEIFVLLFVRRWWRRVLLDQTLKRRMRCLHTVNPKKL